MASRGQFTSLDRSPSQSQSGIFAPKWFSEVGATRSIGIVIGKNGIGNEAYIGIRDDDDEAAGVARILKRGVRLKAHELVEILRFLHGGYFRISTRTRYRCSYVKQGMGDSTLSRGFETLGQARAYAQSLIQDECAGVIEKHREWRNVLYDKDWHRDCDDPDAIEIVECFPKREAA